MGLLSKLKGCSCREIGDDGSLQKRSAMIQLMSRGLPAAIAFTATMMSNTISFSYVGAQSNEDMQAGHGLGYSIGNVLIITIGLGLVNGLDTLCPLTIGVGRPDGCWSHLFQALTVVILTAPLLVPLVVFSPALLKAIGQDAVISDLAGEYLVASLPGLYFVCIFEALRKFLIYHRYYVMQTVISLLTVPVQIGFLELFVSSQKMGLLGAGLARTCTWSLISTSLIFYIALFREAFGWSNYRSRCRSESTQQVNNEVQSSGEDSSNRICRKPKCPSPHTLHTRGASPQRIELQHLGPPSITENTGETTENVSGIKTHEVSNDKPSIAFRNEAPNNDSEGSHNWRASSRCEGGSGRSESFKSSADLLAVTSVIKYMQPWWAGIGQFFCIALPSTFLCMFEWIAFEAQIFIGAYLGSVEVAALSASASLSSLIFIMSLSIGVILTGEIGRAMGNKRPKDAVVFAIAGCLSSLCIAVPIAIIILICRVPISKFYSASPSIRAAIVRNLIPQCFVLVFDSLHGTLGGALNLQRYGCMFDALGLLVVMQAVGISLAFKTDLKGSGFIVGTSVGLIIVLMGYCFLLKFTNWEKRTKALIG